MRSSLVAWPERKRHRSFDDHSTVDARNTLELTHPAAQTPDRCLDDDDVSRMHWTPVTHALDAHEVDQLFAILRLCENHDRADLRHRLGQDRRRQHRRITVTVREVSLVQRDVLDPDDALVGLEFGNAIDEQEWIAMRKNPFDGRVVERERQVHVSQPV